MTWTKQACTSPQRGSTERGPVQYQTSGQKQQITIIGCGNEVGQVIPPFIIFAAKQLNYLWMRSEVPGSCFTVSENGWVDHELFSFFLTKHFMTHAVSLLLLLDGSSTHFETRSLEFAAKHDVIIFYLPPHTTHAIGL